MDGEVGRLQQDLGPGIGEQQPSGAVQAQCRWPQRAADETASVVLVHRSVFPSPAPTVKAGEWSPRYRYHRPLCDRVAVACRSRHPLSGDRTRVTGKCPNCGATPCAPR